jgi:hypothetical protein
LRQDDFCKTQLVMMGWRFGQSYSGGHLAGQMVMHALANRVRCGWGAWLQVIENVPTFMAENEMPPLKFPSIWEPMFVKLLHTVDGIYDGSVPDLTHGGLYWGDLSRIERPWFKAKIIQAVDEEGAAQHKRVADMNSLSFWA